jgi:hypothetical protein
MAEPNIGQIAATAWEFVHGDGPTDNIFTSQALLYLLREGGHQEYADGGRLFEMTVEYKINPTFKSVSEMETLDTTRVDVFDAARYEQKIVAGTVVFSNLEDLRNAVANRKIDVVKGKLKNATNSALEYLDGVLFLDGTGNAGKDPDGLQKTIPDNPLVGTVGTINAGLWTFWRSRQQAGNMGTQPFDNLRAALESVHNQCTLGGTDRKPTGIVTDRTSFEGYISTVTQIERLVKDSNGGADPDLGWLNDAIQFKGVPMVYDEQAPAGRAYFLNKNYLKLIVMQGGWMKMLKPVDPANQLATVHRVMSVLNLCASARRHQGVVTSIS